MTLNRRYLSEKQSVLLSEEENDLLNNLIGPEHKNKASAVVQVYAANPPNCSSAWKKVCCGVLCLVANKTKKWQHYLRVYSLHTEEILWHEELKRPTQYLAQKQRFHVFEGQESVIGFNFADASEAKTFFMVAVSVPNNSSRKERKKKDTGKPVCASDQSQLVQESRSASKKPLDKADISEPFHFRQISHVGWDPDGGFALENVDQQLLPFFTNKLNITKEAGAVSQSRKGSLMKDNLAGTVGRRNYAITPRNQMSPVANTTVIDAATTTNPSSPFAAQLQEQRRRLESKRMTKSQSVNLISSKCNRLNSEEINCDSYC